MMNPMDIGIVAIVAVFLIRGFSRGIIKELVSLAGILGGLYLSLIYYKDAAALIEKWFPNFSYVNIVGFIMVFVAVLIGAAIMGSMVKYLASAVFLGGLDRMAGALFGAFKGILLITSVLTALVMFAPKNISWVTDSKLSPYLFFLSEKVFESISNHTGKGFEETMDSFKKKMGEISQKHSNGRKGNI